MTGSCRLSLRSMRQSWRLCVLFIVTLGLFSCVKAFSKIAYHKLLPQIILQRIDAFFDLNSSQKNYLRERIAVHHKWHHESQLRLYQTDLKDLRERFARQLKPADLNWLTDKLTIHRNAIFSRVIPDLIHVLQTLSPEQISYFEKKLAKENKDLAEKLARPLAVRQQEEFKVILEHAENWAGKLSDNQKAELRARYAAIPAAADDWLRYREDQQRAFVALLRAKPDSGKLKADLEARMLYQERNVPKQFRAGFARAITLMKEMILTADRLLTPEQRQRVIRKADEYIQLLAELAS